MFGRSIGCLLVILCLAPVPLVGQAGHVPDPAAAPDLTPRIFAPIQPAPDPLARPLPHAPGAIGLRQISRAAGMIFFGKVIAIERRAATRGQSVQTVTITFRVEDAIRGATPGELLTISQWIGLWTDGQRYRVGERLLLFLYPRSKLGLTSCVAGTMGRFNLDAFGRVLFSAQHLSAFRSDPVLGGKSRVSFSDFALAVRRASEEE
jgi:hypothetical protein